MKRATSIAVLTTAAAAIALPFGVSHVSTASPLATIAMDKARHDICIGTLDPNGLQHPLICINLPQT